MNDIVRQQIPNGLNFFYRKNSHPVYSKKISISLHKTNETLKHCYFDRK
jgi:hypothetical protein